MQTGNDSVFPLCSSPIGNWVIGLVVVPRRVLNPFTAFRISMFLLSPMSHTDVNKLWNGEAFLPATPNSNNCFQCFYSTEHNTPGHFLEMLFCSGKYSLFYVQLSLNVGTLKRAPPTALSGDATSNHKSWNTFWLINEREQLWKY